MGCSGSKKESPLDPSDVQLSGGDPLSQLSGGDPLSGDWSRSEQRRSSAADLDPSDAFRALDVSRGEADGADEPDGNSFKRRSKAGSARKSSFSKKKAPKLEKKKISFSDEAVDMETSEVAPLPATALRLRVTQAKVSANTFGVVDMPPDRLTTTVFVNEAQQAAERLEALGKHVDVSVVSGTALQEKGYNLLYSVGKAAEEPPALLPVCHRLGHSRLCMYLY